ncbi:MAG: VTT domain-containing protein [Acidobacteriota bacterium]
MAEQTLIARLRAHARTLLGALRTVPRGIWLKLAGLVLIVLTGTALIAFTPLGDYFTWENIQATLDQIGAQWWAPIVFILLFIISAAIAIPPSPLVMAGGAVFGIALGTLWNVIGLFLGALIAYIIGRSLGRDFIAHIAGESLKKAEAVFDQRGFWPLVQARFLPMPFAFMNYGAALAGVKPVQYLITTILGLLPTTLMHTTFASMVVRAEGGDAKAWWSLAWGIAFVGVGVLTNLPTLRAELRRRKRKKEMREESERVVSETAD